MPELNQAMDRARLLTVPAERAKAWAEVDRMVIEQAPAVLVAWQKQALLRSENVVGMVNESMAFWDLTFTSVR